MNQTELLKKYLASREEMDIHDHGYPFVTISRQVGAGGHSLGREIIRQLDAQKDEGWNHGWDLFDQKLCAMLAQDPATQASFESLLKEEFKDEFNQIFYEMFIGKAEQYTLQKRIAAVVRFLGYIGRTVIIGRGGMCVTRDMRPGVHVRLVAAEEYRIPRMMEALESSREQAVAEMHKQDRERASAVRTLYGKDSSDPLLYDMVLNTGTLDNAEMAEAVVRLIAARRRMTPIRHPRPFRH